MVKQRLEDLAAEIQVVVTSLSADFKGTGLTDAQIREKIKPQIDKLQSLMQERLVESGQLEPFLKTVNTHIVLPGMDSEHNPMEYIVDFDVEVTPRGILEIMPGARLHFTEHGGILCYGILKAGNTSNYTYTVFTAADRSWKNITFAGSFADNSYLHVCEIRGGTGRKIVPARPMFTQYGTGNTSLGGGILILRSSPTIESCRIAGNSADGGGGLYAVESHARVSRCNFCGNTQNRAQGNPPNNVNHYTLVNCSIQGEKNEVEGVSVDMYGRLK